MTTTRPTGSSPVRIGVVGCGEVLGAYMALAEELHARGAVDVVAACGRAHQRAFAEDKLGIPRFTTEYRSVVEDPGVDLVLVLTSTKAHAEIAAAALAAGKNVLVEKPMAATLEEASELVSLARRSRGFLLCAPFTPLSATFQILQMRIQRGDIGKVMSARGRYGFAGPDWHPWFYQQGGGPLFDLGVYSVTTLTGLLGPAKRVTAMTGTAVPVRMIRGQSVKVEVEDNAHVIIDFGGACFATVTTGFTIQRYRSPAVEIYGTGGTLQMLGDDWDPDGYELWQPEAGGWQVYPESDPVWTWTDGLKHMVDCIQRGVPPRLTPEHAFHVLEILIKAKASGSDGKTRTLDSTFTSAATPEDASSRPHYLLHDRIRRLGD